MGAILCVDDEEFVLTALSQDLRKHFSDDFLVELAQNADDAMEILDELEDEHIKVLVIISDWLMPGMKGDEFLIKAHERFPHVVKIMLTGQSNEHAVNNAKENANLKEVFSKPWNGEELCNSIKKELGLLNE